MTAGYAWTAWLFWIGGSIVALIGVLLLAWAILWDRPRGRRRCPRCWYDMSGTPGNLTCSECGKKAKRESKLYKTRRRWRWATVAVVLIVSSVGTVGWYETRNLDWNTVKPVWLLVLQGDGGTPTALAARAEIVRRITAGELSAKQVHFLVEHALTVQADPDSFWNGPVVRFRQVNWGTVIEEARDRDLATDEQFSRYLMTAFGKSFNLTARPRVRTGIPIPVRISTGIPRLSNRWHAVGENSHTLVALAELTRVPKSLTHQFPSRWIQIGTAASGGMMTEPRFIHDLAPGQHLLTFECEFIVLELNAPQGIDSNKQHLSEFEQPLAHWSRQYTVKVEVVPPDEYTVSRVRDDSMIDSVRAAFQMNLIGNKITIGSGYYGGRYGVLLVDPLPVALSFDVYGRVGSVEHLAGSFASPAARTRVDNVGFDAFKRNLQALFPNATTVELIMRTNVEAAEGTIDITHVWDGEVVIQGVPIRRENPTKSNDDG